VIRGREGGRVKEEKKKIITQETNSLPLKPYSSRNLEQAS
jgi:hypothetical protein